MSVCFKIVPANLELISERPEEVAIDVGIPLLVNALADFSDLFVRELRRVEGALTILSDIRISTVGSLLPDISIQVDSDISSEVGLGAVDPLATTWVTSIIEVTKPEGAVVGCKRPFTDPDLILVFANHLGVLLVGGADTGDVVVVGVPSSIVVIINNDIVDVIIGEEIVPIGWVLVEGVMEDELEMRCLLAHHLSDVAVEVPEDLYGVLDVYM